MVKVLRNVKIINLLSRSLVPSLVSHMAVKVLNALGTSLGVVKIRKNVKMIHRTIVSRSSVSHMNVTRRGTSQFPIGNCREIRESCQRSFRALQNLTDSTDPSQPSRQLLREFI